MAVSKVSALLVSVALKSLSDPDPGKIQSNVRYALSLALRLRLSGSYAYLGLYSQFRDALMSLEKSWVEDSLVILERGCSTISRQAVNASLLDALLGDYDALVYLVAAQQCGHELTLSRKDADSLRAVYGDGIADVVLGAKTFDELAEEKGWLKAASDEIYEFWPVWHAFRRSKVSVRQ